MSMFNLALLVLLDVASAATLECSASQGCVGESMLQVGEMRHQKAAPVLEERTSIKKEGVVDPPEDPAPEAEVSPECAACLTEKMHCKQQREACDEAYKFHQDLSICTEFEHCKREGEMACIEEGICSSENQAEAEAQKVYPTRTEEETQNRPSMIQGEPWRETFAKKEGEGNPKKVKKSKEREFVVEGEEVQGKKGKSKSKGSSWCGACLYGFDCLPGKEKCDNSTLLQDGGTDALCSAFEACKDDAKNKCVLNGSCSQEEVETEAMDVYPLAMIQHVD